jgi:perosamine synthetase
MIHNGDRGRKPPEHRFQEAGHRRKSRILYTKPSITPLEVSYATDAATNGWGEHCHDYVDRFEAAFAEHLRVPYAIATSSCTGALHMGLAAIGLGPGDEVIIADTNWIASAAPIT